MTTIRQMFCTSCKKAYAYYPSYSGSKPKNWGRSTKELCPECVEKEKAVPSKPDCKGLSSDCTLDRLLVTAILIGGKEHPCDRCNMDRKVCRGYPKKGNDHEPT